MLIEVVSAGPGCSICQKALKLVKQVAVEFPQIETQELSVIDHFERLLELNIFSAGAILINGKTEFVSVPSLPKLYERVHELLNHESDPLNERRK
ncbi:MULTISPECIES: thioredoxin family protein [Paenibacillus]|uniref:thioredoxin family protein n=1 Tax=Paenibacillus TaxID=44249 RepID=UPI00026C6349|nr:MULTISPECIES: thioredoxin family protein [Paenibacillus]MBW4085720.1 thioredoxin family protein [Paenibacillus sp. S150]MEC0182219.1 thioredoxin family protein [Paenibacillus peoriae]